MSPISNPREWVLWSFDKESKDHTSEIQHRLILTAASARCASPSLSGSLDLKPFKRFPMWTVGCALTTALKRRCESENNLPTFLCKAGATTIVFELFIIPFADANGTDDQFSIHTSGTGDTSGTPA
jgi:hypothetical protein